jgi:4-methyl-5(b-hydroxyethyl)-thiazole monophosphate biosynthesis
MVVVFLANGFEEIEALATIDVLRRADLDVVTVGVGGETVTGAHGITVKADRREDDLPSAPWQAVVLPGGIPGTPNLEASDTVQQCIDIAATGGALLCAICAAPSILGHKGLLKGKRAVCYPGYESDLIGAVISEEPVAADGNVITAKGAGVSVEFALRIVEALTSSEKARELGDKMQCR